MKIKRTFVRKEAYNTLRNWIVDGTLKPGIKIQDKELAAKMGVSRTPIREALLKLEDEGLVQTKPNRSTQVSPIDLENAADLYAIVSSLEQLAIKQAFERLTDKEIEKMTQANERMLQSLKNKDRKEALDADHEFHFTYIQLSQNQELIKILSDLKTKLTRIDLFYFEQIEEAHLSYSEHEQVIAALKQKNLPLTLAAIERNWLSSFSRIKDLYVSK